jgi:hypothetical protein
MLSPRLTLLAAALTLTLGGCANIPTGSEEFQGVFTVDPAFSLPSTKASPAKTEAAKNPDKKPYYCSAEALETFDLDRDSLPGISAPAYQHANTTILRNRLQTHLMSLSDRNCECHKGAIYANAAGSNFGLGTLTSVFGTTGALVSGEAASRVLSGLAGVTNATRAQMNENFYQNYLAGAILKAIDKDRAQTAQEIERRQVLVLDRYSLDAAIRDAQAYHQKCSFYAGVAALTAEAAKIGPSTNELKGQLDEIRNQIAANESSFGKGSEQAKKLNDPLLRQLEIMQMQLIGTTNGVPQPVSR